jgi:hypothetical protein
VVLSRALPVVRPEERRVAAAAFVTIFGALAAHTLLETARDALFLSRLPASRLAIVYFAIAIVAVAIAQAPWGRRRAGGAYALARLLGGGAAATFLFWSVGRWQSPLELYALYVWTGLLGSLVVLQFWMVLSDLYTVTQAKRLYNLVWTGSLLGASAGAVLARFIAQRTSSASSLVLASAVVLALTAAVPAVALGRAAGRGRPTPARRRPTLAEGVRLFQREPYVHRLAVLVLVSTVALTLGDYVFKSAVARNVPEAQLGTFFGGLYTVLNLASLFAQVALGSWLFRVIGVHRALWILPSLLFVGAAGVALGGGLVAALLLKGADGSLRNSVHRTGNELLYVPLPDGVRAQAKPLIDLVGQRGGQALASVLILSETFLQRGDVVLAGAAAAVSVLWIAWVADLKELYLDVFRAALREGTLRPAADLPPVDLVSLETLFGGLNSADDNEVIAAMDLLEAEGRARLVPALILHHPSQRVVLRALEMFSGAARTDFLPVADRLLRHADPEIRAGALRARTLVAPDEGRLRAAAADPDPLVQATAVAFLVAGEWAGDEAAASLSPLLARPDGEAALALARAIARHPSPAFSETLLRLAESPSPRVLAETARAMGQLRRAEFLPSLLAMLGEREARAEARGALLAYEAEGLEFLDRSLADRGLPIELRRHLPRAVSLFPPAGAAAVLERHLLEETSGVVRYRLLRAMNRLAAAGGARFDPALLRRAVDRTIEAVFRLVHWHSVLEEGARVDPGRVRPGHELLVQLLEDKEGQARERLFRLLAILDPEEDFKGIFRGLRASDVRTRASSRELLENVLEPPLRGAVLAIVEEAGDAVRLAGAAGFYAIEPLGYEELLGIMLERGGESLRCIVAYHVGELGLASLRPRIEALGAEQTSFFLSRVLERTLGSLPGREGLRA